MRNGLLYVMPVVLTVVVAFQPAALQVSFLTAMVWGAGQGYLFKRAWFRKFFRMEAFPIKSAQTNYSSKAREIATEKIHQATIAAPASGKPVRTLRTVAQTPLHYEAPRARAQREMAVFHPPKGIETKTSKKPAAPSKGILQSLTGAPEQMMEYGRKQMGMAAPPTPKQQRAEEYERRRRNERKYEADTRRQGRR